MPGADYGCPMDPEVRQQGPGICPICGMALEPEMVSLDDRPDPEELAMARRFRICLPLAALTLILAMGGMAPGLSHLFMRLPANTTRWLQLLLSAPVVLWGGAPFFQRAWESLKRRRANMFTLIGLGTGAAWGFSVAVTLAPGLIPAALRDGMGLPPVYFESAAVIIALVQLGQWLESRARRKTGDALRALLGLAPAGAWPRTGMNPMRRWGKSWRATSCACAPAKRFRWMAG